MSDLLFYHCSSSKGETRPSQVVVENGITPARTLILYATAYSLHPNPFSSGTDFRRQNLTSTDVRIRRLKSIPALKEYNVQEYDKKHDCILNY